MREISVRIDETQVIVPMQERACPCGFLFKLANGDLVVGGEMSGVDWPADHACVPLDESPLSWRRSKDRGQTWKETPAWPTYAPYQFPDGEIMQISGRWWQIEPDYYIYNRYNNAYSIALFRSTDDGYIFKKKRVLICDIPRLAKVKCQHSDKERYANVNHQIVRLHDDSLLASAQGQFEGDIKERVFAIRSTDRGVTWNYLSTVAFDLRKGKKIRPLGFDEPNLLVLPDGDILCFMRTGGGKHRGSLYMSRSRDNGKTWSHADPIADRGVYPTACLMSNGIIAVVYGRLGDWIIFSPDQGQTWSDPFCFHRGPEAYDCGGYDWVEEVAPDTLLAVYSRTDPDDNRQSEIVGTFITVRPR